VNAHGSKKEITEPAEVRYVPVEGIEAYHGATVYYAVLAYPGRDEWPKRVEFVRGCKR
jgi:hypothetical protein